MLSARSGGALSPGSGVNSGSRGSPSQARLGGFESPAPVGAAAVPSGLGDRDRSSATVQGMALLRAPGDGLQERPMSRCLHPPLVLRTLIYLGVASTSKVARMAAKPLGRGGGGLSSEGVLPSAAATAWLTYLCSVCVLTAAVATVLASYVVVIGCTVTSAACQ